MGVLSIILFILFIAVCLFIIFFVLLQNEEGDSIGGLFAGGSNSAFGSKSGNVLTKATYIMVSLFFLSSFFLAFLNRSPSDAGLSKEAQIQQTEKAAEWWNEEGTKESAEEAENTGSVIEAEKVSE